VYEATRKEPCCAFRKFKELLEHYKFKFDYQLLARVIDWRHEDCDERSIRPHAHMLQSIAKNFFQKAERRKKFRKRRDPMPLQVRSGECFRLGKFGSRGKNEEFYNCEVSINGLRIKGRLPGFTPEGRILEGVSLVREADGWWASIKVELPIRVPPPVVPGSVVGIDVGLDNIAALSEITAEGRVIAPARRVANDRGKIYAERIAGRQAENKPVGRLHLAASRHAKHVIYNQIIKPLASVEMINVEKLNGRIGQMGGSVKVSSMKTTIKMLQERYGTTDKENKAHYRPDGRVRERDPRFTSQDCSQCGFRSKETWSYEHGRIGKCPRCGYSADRDINAARNLALKSAE
jgi:putative transposase